MIEFIKNYFKHHDGRGSIIGLIDFGNWKEINIIESEKGIVRGNHYHKDTDELFIILDGAISIKLQEVCNEKFVNGIEKYFIKKGDVFIIRKNINHSFEILESSRWLNALSIKTDLTKPDILRVKDD